MAVFTDVPFAEAAALLARLGAGALERLTGIASGIENTNYFADTSEQRLVITLFERLGRSELPFYLELMSHLAARGLPVPRPLAAQGGGRDEREQQEGEKPASREGDERDAPRSPVNPVAELVHTLAGKPAAVTVRLPGAPQLQPGAAHCEAVGATLARLHLEGRDYARQQPSPRGLPFWSATVPWLAPLLPAASGALLTDELVFQQQLASSAAYAALPRGATHGDLFRDNVLFEGERLTGLLDFFFAGTDTFLFDIAVCLNDWCTTADGRLIEERAAGFVAAYAAVRRLDAEERALLPALLRAAALRFWITRLADVHRPRDASLLTPHDPAHFERILQRRVAEPWQP